MPSQSSMLHVRVDDQTKAEATAALNELGLSVSAAVRLFLRRVAAEKSFPLELKKPNGPTRAAMAEADEIASARSGRFKSAEAVFHELEKIARK